MKSGVIVNVALHMRDVAGCYPGRNPAENPLPRAFERAMAISNQQPVLSRKPYRTHLAPLAPDDMVARARSDRKGLKRELAAIKAEEQRASTWLVRISLVLLLLGWAYSEYASNTSATPRTRTTASARKKQAVGAGTADLKPFLLATGAA